MAELKIHCACGQKYKFEVEPINNRMPYAVACPVCGANGTDQANILLEQATIFKPIEAAPAAAAPPPPPPPAPVAPRAAAPALSISHAAPAPAAAAPASRPSGHLGVAPPNMEQVEAEARAKILWGDKPDEVIHYLMIQGLPHEEASEKVHAMIKERLSTIRSKGLVKTMAGLIGTLAAGGILFLFLKVGFYSPFVLGIVGLGVVMGLWLFLNGLFKFLAPGTQMGDASEEG